ncbi:hypothetical protein VTO73DRAFT_8427 [Trametes versicolor]
MGQTWNFFNLDKMEWAHPEGKYKLGCIIYAKQAFLVRSLAIPYPVPELAGYLANAPPPGPVAKKGLLSLPDELLDDILYCSGLSDAFDSVCLAITCKKLLTIAQGRVLREARDYSSAGWAMDRIVCLGDYVDLDNVPEGLLSPAQKSYIVEQAEARGWGLDELGYAGLADIGTYAQQYRGLYYESVDFVMTLPMPDRRLFVAALAMTFPARDDWALCNHSKHEFVRAGALAELSGQPGAAQPFLQTCEADLGTALFTRFCYSPDPSTALPNTSVKIHEGKWVGDRISIDTMERVKQRQPQQEWTDVTDEVVADIEAIYRDEYDDDWEERLTEPHVPRSFESFYFWHDDADKVAAMLRSPE